jgi:hypothetical protein
LDQLSGQLHGRLVSETGKDHLSETIRLFP